MIEFLPAADHVLAFKVTGTLTADDYDRLIAELEPKLDRHRRLGVVGDLSGFTDVTLEAAGKDFAYSFSRIASWSRFPRAALVTDRQWLKTLVSTVDPLVPFVEARTFEPGRQAEAVAWVSKVDPGRA